MRPRLWTTALLLAVLATLWLLDGGNSNLGNAGSDSANGYSAELKALAASR